MLFSTHSRRARAASVAEWQSEHLHSHRAGASSVAERQSRHLHSRRVNDPIRAIAPKPSVAAHCRVRRLAFEKFPIIFQKALDKSRNVC